MGTRLTLSGADWGELLTRHERNVEALRAANRRALDDAQVTIQDILAEASLLIENCRRLEQKSRAFEEAMAGFARAGEKLAAEVDSIPDGLLSAVSHKLLSPLTSVCSFSEILGDSQGLPIEQRNGFLDIAIRESERLTRMIDQVVDLALLRLGRAAWNIVDVDLGRAVDDAVATIGPLFHDKVVRLDVSLPDDLPPVRADCIWLARVVENLLANAARFAEAGKGRVGVDAETTGDMVTVSVADDGPGIEPERQKIIFAQFLEIDDTPSDQPQGVGLGLALCKQIVEHLGGRIRVDSAPGDGARFLFTVPTA